MKVVLLGGGRGSRMGLETEILPKPMVTIGGIPILQHIMNYYAKFGYKDFIILGGYRVEVIEQYFSTMMIPEGWKVDVVDTGLDTPTGGRLLQAEHKLIQPFMLTYGDGLSNVNLAAIEKNYPRQNEIGIITAVHPPGRFGTLSFDDHSNYISRFDEKQRLENQWINGGFMAFNHGLFNYIEEGEMLEFDVFPRLAEDRKITANFHSGFWQCMDTPRDRQYLEELWKLKRCYWR